MNTARNVQPDSVFSHWFGRIKYVRPVLREEASGLVAEVYRRISEEFLILPPVVLHSPVSELLAGSWSILRETLLTGRVPRMTKEAVAVGVSEANVCPYCIEWHTLMLREAGASTDMLMIRRDENRVGAFIDWAACAARGVSAPTPLPFRPYEACEIIGTGVAFHYFNRMVNVFLDRSPLPLPSGLRWIMAIMEKLASRNPGRRMPNTPGTPGTSSSLLPAAELPTDLFWTRKNAAVAGAFARMARVVEDVGTAFVPAAVRALITERLDRWHGERLTAIRSWAIDAVQELDEVNRPMAMLLLFAALASYAVDAPLVAAARKGLARQENSDQVLVGAVAWAAFSAARRAASWLDPGAQTPVKTLAEPIS